MNVGQMKSVLNGYVDSLEINILIDGDLIDVREISDNQIADDEAEEEVILDCVYIVAEV